MTLEDLGAYIEANGLGTLATDMFLHSSPDKPDEHLLLVEYASDEPEWVQEKKKVDYENPRIQVSARSMRPEVSRLRCELVYQLLMQIENEDLSGTRYLWVKPIDSPAMVGRDENGRYITTANFRVAKELSSV